MFNSPSIRLAAKQHACDEYPREAVGIVVENSYKRLKNIHSEPETGFLTEELFEDNIQALVHSHPNGKTSPSIQDMVNQQAMDIPWGIVSCTQNEASHIEWFGDGTPVPNYIGRTFLDGVRDCWCLVRDWYKIELGVVLKNLPREENWYLPKPRGLGMDLLNPHTIRECGFEQIDRTQLKRGDVILARVASPVTNHAALYLGGGLILHHMGGRLSCKQPAGRWANYAEYYVRHTSCK